MTDRAAGSLLTEFASATVSDALDSLGTPGALLGIAPLFDGARLCGRAYTVRYVQATDPAGTVGDFLDDVEPGSVIVLDNASRKDCTVWGDLLTAAAHHRDIAGTVIDGVCRDVRLALDIPYPIFSRGRFMRTGKDRVQAAEVGGELTIAGVHVAAGDILVGDADGVVAVPAALEERVADACRLIVERESAILADVLAGRSLAEARERYGYHLLQRPGRS